MELEAVALARSTLAPNGEAGQYFVARRPLGRADRQQGGINKGHPLAFALAGMEIGTERDQGCPHQLNKAVVTHHLGKGSP